MLKIERITGDGDGLLLRLAGRLIGAWVPELASECDRALAREPRLSLDLAAVSFVDGAGADLLRALTQRNVTLLHCSPFVAEHLGMRTS
jgi:anti-anti-sigma regulatory factor